MVVFDVGANNGYTGWKKLYRLTREKPCLTSEDKVYAFEPTPQLIDRFLRVFERGAPDNYIVVPKAVSLKDGIADFHLAHKRPGCSSLHEFDPNDSWKENFKMYETIKVETIRLDTFIISNNIDTIDYLHCDAQGSDLDVLKSLGDKIDIVRGGRVEAHHVNTPLYNYDNSINSIVSFLDDHGFKIRKRDLLLNTKQQETDIHFSNPGHRDNQH
jgi:FkbM family methyltransferase